MMKSYGKKKQTCPFECDSWSLKMFCRIQNQTSESMFQTSALHIYFCVWLFFRRLSLISDVWFLLKYRTKKYHQTSGIFIRRLFYIDLQNRGIIQTSDKCTRTSESVYFVFFVSSAFPFQLPLICLPFDSCFYLLGDATSSTTCKYRYIHTYDFRCIVVIIETVE